MKLVLNSEMTSHFLPESARKGSDYGFWTHIPVLLLHFSSADLEPHQSGKPPPGAFQFGIMEFLRTAFGLSIVQWKSLVTICPVSSCGVNH